MAARKTAASTSRPGRPQPATSVVIRAGASICAVAWPVADAGALGDELAAELFARGWIERARGREIRATAKGTRGLRRTFGVAL